MLAVAVPTALSAPASDQYRQHRTTNSQRHHHRRKHRRAKAHHSPRQNAATQIPGVTVSPNGWVHYEDSSQAYLAGEVESTLAKIVGKHLPGGGCGFKDQATIPRNALEVVEDELAFNPETCESVVEQKVSLKPPLPKTEPGSGAHTRTVPADPRIIEFKSGHTKTQWVDPLGITITSLNADLTWPVAGPTAGRRGKAYQYAFDWDGWQKSGLKESTVYKVYGLDPSETILGSKTYNFSDGWSFHAHEDFTNTDFYEALHHLSPAAGFYCSEADKPAVFHHAVKVTGYRSGQMGYWRETKKKGACNNLVHKVERIGWGLKGPEHEKIHPPPSSPLIPPIRIPTLRYAALEEEFEAAPDVLPEIPYPVDSWIPEGQVTQNSALLEGTVNPEGKDNVYRFECGTTEAYGMWTSPLASAGTGSEPVGVSATVPNLTPNTTYHCRLVVLASLGDASKGPDQTFTTPPVIPSGPVVSTNDAVELRQKTAILTGVVDPHGKSTSYYFQYGYWTTYGNTIPALPGGDVGSGTDNVYVANEIAGLEPGTTYYYRIVATNADGTTYGSDRSFKTLESLPPEATTEPATEIRPTGARINATINPNGGDTHYYISYGKTSYSNYEAILPAAPGGGSAGSGVSRVAVSEQVTGLKPGTTYRYQVVAVNSAGGTLGAERTFTTVGPGVEVLPPGEVTQSKILMAAKVDGVGLPTTYWFEYGNTAAYGFKTEAKAAPAGNGLQPVSAALEGLPVGWTVHYRIVATSSEGTNASPDQVATTGWREESSYASELDSAAEWLKDVSCASAGSCVAVGGYINKSPWQTEIAASLWDGTDWTPIDPPSPAGYYAELEGVSCATATSCLAVGTVLPAANIARPVVMKWDGNTWTEIAAPQSPPSVNYYLTDISCPTVDSCEAVGYRANVYSPNSSDDARPLTLHWDGSSWTTRVSANPNTPGGEPSKEGSLLESVSCASASFCKAVGRHYSSVAGEGAFKPLIERLSGTEWVTEEANTLSYPATETDFWLEGVSCPTTTACLAVGYSGTGHNEFDPNPKKAFTQRWTGSQWVSPGLPEEANTATELYDVSCSSATSCRAVGKNGRAADWTGTQGWKLQAPKPPSDAYPFKPELTLNGISCPTVAECHSVGSYVTYSGKQRLAQGWSGAGVAPRTSLAYPEAVTETTATVRGYVDPAGVDATYYFEYGPTTSYGSKTAEFSAGSGALGLGGLGGWFEGKAILSGLSAGSKYHYRIVATNGSFTENGPDYTFETISRLDQMPITEPFNATSSAVSDFATKWAKPGWLPATGNYKGKNNANGWGPVEAGGGAYFMPTINDTGSGVGTVATLGTAGTFLLWLDLQTPTATTKSGYELRFQSTAANVYTVTIAKWTAGTQTVLATKTGYSFPVGSSFALADTGAAVEAWTNTGAGFTKLLSASDATYSGGNTGVEAVGTATRLTKFKAGALLEKAASTDAALKAVPVTDALTKSETPLSGAGAWSALFWDTKGANETGVIYAGGWSSAGAFPSVYGAYWKKAASADSGGGDAAIATLAYPSTFGIGYFSLWLNAPSPNTAKSGYELRMSETSSGVFEAKISKWVAGVATTLTTKANVIMPGGFKLALIDKGGVVSAWLWNGISYSQIVTASDSTYSYGYGGIETSSMPMLKLKEFKLGPLSPQ
jgi:hypothetical protein